MLQEKWDEIVERIKSSCKVLSHRKEALEPAGEAEILEFLSPAGKMKLVRNVHPRVEQKKVLSHRRTEGAQVEYIYSQSETVNEVQMYLWDDDAEEWREKEFNL